MFGAHRSRRKFLPTNNSYFCRECRLLSSHLCMLFYGIKKFETVVVSVPTFESNNSHSCRVNLLWVVFYSEELDLRFKILFFKILMNHLSEAVSTHNDGKNQHLNELLFARKSVLMLRLLVLQFCKATLTVFSDFFPQVEIRCMGQTVLPTLLLYNLVDLWLQTASTSERVPAIVGSSAKDFVMVLAYARRVPDR